ncbi:MAG TPA: serine/threonine-protein kinase, partial [Myxococcales bacterium]|nr:serine/threonine-protein kinase [Myxococcales bacterium]
MERVGRYELVQKLATGGMAEVFLAKTVGPGGFEKVLVVKRILPHLVEEREFVEMFLSEAKLAALLNHHNVVQIFDFGQADGAYFIAMELVDGPNLRVLSKRAQELNRPIPFPLCAKIISLACEGLAYAHGLTDPSSGQPLNLVHRDISPDNIMVTRTGGVKVVDFGIAKAASQAHRTGSGVVKGKLAYMPVEQLASSPLDRRTDVYALG